MVAPKITEPEIAEPRIGEDTADPTYAFKPSLIGRWYEFTLKSDGLHWQMGGSAGRVRYERIRAVRLSFRPVTMQSRRFITEIWSTDNPKIQIVSVSWRSMVEQARQDGAYSAFVTELHQRLATSGSKAQFTTGLPVVSYWFGVVTFAAVSISMAAMIVRTLKLEQWSASAIIGAIFAVFALQIGNYFRRNRPSRYRPDAIPREVLPKA
jgi:hypothetical protein